MCAPCPRSPLPTGKAVILAPRSDPRRGCAGPRRPGKRFLTGAVSGNAGPGSRAGPGAAHAVHPALPGPPGRPSSDTARSSCPLRNASQHAHPGAHAWCASGRFSRVEPNRTAGAWSWAGRGCSEPGDEGLIETPTCLPSASVPGPCRRGRPDVIEEVTSCCLGGSFGRDPTGTPASGPVSMRSPLGQGPEGLRVPSQGRAFPGDGGSTRGRICRAVDHAGARNPCYSSRHKGVERNAREACVPRELVTGRWLWRQGTIMRKGRS